MGTVQIFTGMVDTQAQCVWSQCDAKWRCIFLAVSSVFVERFMYNSTSKVIAKSSYTNRMRHSLFCREFVSFKADSHITCRAHVVPLPCHAAKGLEWVFPIWFTQCGPVCFTLAMPRPCHPLPCHSSKCHGAAWPSRKSLWTNCPRSASSGYHAEFREVVIRRIPISDAGGQCETKHRLSWTRKIVVAAHYKKDDLLHCWTSSRIFPATMRTFTKDTALSEQGRGAAWHVWINARHGRGTAWARHVMCESSFNMHCNHSQTASILKRMLCVDTLFEGMGNKKRA